VKKHKFGLISKRYGSNYLRIILVFQKAVGCWSKLDQNRNPDAFLPVNTVENLAFIRHLMYVQNYSIAFNGITGFIGAMLMEFQMLYASPIFPVVEECAIVF
jgi:hypothetical protein